MKQTLVYITILSVLFCCKRRENNNNQTISQKDTIVKFNKVKEKEKSVENKINFDSTKTFRTVYVTAKNGLIYRENPNLSSKKIGTFELGTELKIIEDTNIDVEIEDDNKTIVGKWVKVKSKIDKDDKNIRHFNYNYIGYVFDGFLSDTLILSKKGKPIHINEIWNNDIWPKTNINKLNLTFKKIHNKEFNELKSNYSRQITNDSKIEAENGKYFILKTKKSSIKFPCDYSYSSECFYYKGYLNNLNLHGIELIGQGVGVLALLDSKTDKLYAIQSNFDDSYKMPLLSKNKKLLAFYATDSYDIESEISIYTLKNNKIDFSKKLYFFNNKWKIKELIWISDNSFALKVYDFIDDSEKLTNVRYLKATIE